MNKTIYAIVGIPATALLVLLAVLLLPEANRAKVGGYGNKYRVELYSGGIKVREWTASGKVQSERQSDGYFFKDSASDSLVEISGTVIITKL